MTSDPPTPAASRITPPFSLETARAKVKAAENAWDSRDPEIVAQPYTEDSEQSHGILHRPPSQKGLSETEVGERTRLPFDGGALVLYGQPHLRTIRIRMA